LVTCRRAGLGSDEEKRDEAITDIVEQLESGEGITKNDKGETVMRMIAVVGVAKKWEKCVRDLACTASIVVNPGRWRDGGDDAEKCALWHLWSSCQRSLRMHLHSCSTPVGA
jgi:hypothetical protein